MSTVTAVEPAITWQKLLWEISQIRIEGPQGWDRLKYLLDDVERGNVDIDDLDARLGPLNLGVVRNPKHLYGRMRHPGLYLAVSLDGAVQQPILVVDILKAAFPPPRWAGYRVLSDTPGREHGQHRFNRSGRRKGSFCDLIPARLVISANSN